MRDILSGGILVTRQVPGLPASRAVYARRRRRPRVRTTMRLASAALCSTVQPGQLASPFMKFGFPSLVMH